MATMRSHDLQLFVDILRSSRSSNGKLGLVFDRTLSGPLGLVLEMSALVEQGVSKIYHLGVPPIPRSAHPALLWVLRPDVEATHTLVSCINQCDPGIKHVCSYLIHCLPSFSADDVNGLIMLMCVAAAVFLPLPPPLLRTDCVLCAKEVFALRSDYQ